MAKPWEGEAVACGTRPFSRLVVRIVGGGVAHFAQQRGERVGERVGERDDEHRVGPHVRSRIRQLQLRLNAAWPEAELSHS